MRIIILFWCNVIRNEKEIIRQLKLGDERAYRYLFDNHYVLLCKIAAEYVKDDFIAETIVGSLVVHLWEKRGSIEINTSLRAYLVQSVRNRCLNYLKLEHVRREVRFPNQTNGQSGIDYLALADDSYTLGILLEKELEEEITKAIDRLPDECRRVFKMSRFEQLHYHDIAHQLNISINTVKYHLKNALKKLHDDLGKYLVTILIWIF